MSKRKYDENNPPTHEEVIGFRVELIKGQLEKNRRLMEEQERLSPQERARRDRAVAEKLVDRFRRDGTL